MRAAAAHARRPPGVELWLVRIGRTRTASGAARARTPAASTSTATSPRRWRGGGRPFDTYFPGPRAFSEPETQALRARSCGAIRPDVTVYYHQHLRLVKLVAPAPTAALVARLRAPRRAAGARRCRTTAAPRRAGRTTTFPGTSAFVVELPAGPLSPASARRHAARRAGGGRAPRPAAARRPRPPIVWRRSRSAPRRRAQMRAYARRHYGLDTARAARPEGDRRALHRSGTFSSAFNTFAANAPDVELHERPGVCAHFVIDRDGTIYQLVSLRLHVPPHRRAQRRRDRDRARRRISDAEILGRPAPARAPRCASRAGCRRATGSARRDVIGHAESLSSPYHHERVARLRTQTHGDFAPATMRRYRGKL